MNQKDSITVGLLQVFLYLEILGGYQSRYFNFILGKFTYWLTLRTFRGVPVLILQLDFELRTFRGGTSEKNHPVCESVSVIK